MAIVNICGEINLRFARVDTIYRLDVLTYIRDMLIKAAANDIVMGDESIFFSSPMFRKVLSTNVLSGINGGLIRVVNEPGKIRITYKLGFDRSVVLAGFFGIAIFIFSNWHQFFVQPGANIYITLLEYDWRTAAILAILFAIVNYVWSSIYFRFWFGGGLKELTS